MRPALLDAGNAIMLHKNKVNACSNFCELCRMLRHSQYTTDDSYHEGEDAGYYSGLCESGDDDTNEDGNTFACPCSHAKKSGLPLVVAKGPDNGGSLAKRGKQLD